MQTQGDRYLFDFGIKFTHDGFAPPVNVLETKELDGVFLSHAHLDHSGGLPLLEHREIVCPLFMTHETLALTKILLKDSYKIEHIRHLDPAYGKTDITRVARDTKKVVFDKWYRHRKLTFMFLNAGHIPGSAGILFEAEGKRVLYTGDFNTRKSLLMAPADFGAAIAKHGAIDCLITEATYGDRILPPRDNLEQELTDAILAVLKRGGSVLLPVFAVGRAQEVLLILAKRDWGCPIYFDGMAKEVTRKVLANQSAYVQHKDVLNTMFLERVQFVTSEDVRNKVAQRQPAIFVTTSGMLQGGPCIHYLKHMWHDPKNAVFLLGYQVKGTNGRTLLEEGFITIKGWRTNVKCEIRKFDFSGHADMDDVKKTIWAVHAPKVIVQHGEEQSVVNLLEWVKRETPFEAYGPRIGDEIDL